MTRQKYINVIRIIADTLDRENRCDEHGIEVTALRECADYFEKNTKT